VGPVRAGVDEMIRQYFLSDREAEMVDNNRAKAEMVDNSRAKEVRVSPDYAQELPWAFKAASNEITTGVTASLDNYRNSARGEETQRRDLELAIAGCKFAASLLESLR
jgi:hypothetical protein